MNSERELLKKIYRQYQIGNFEPKNRVCGRVLGEIEAELAKPEAEPVKLYFPTMLRKMWSGDEVQKWLDEQPPLYASPRSMKADMTLPRQALRVAGQTLIGVYGNFPLEHGNCFSVLADDGNEYKIVNFVYENLCELVRRGVRFPFGLRVLAENSAVIHDHRIPDAWYPLRFCEVCCPDSLLPMPQRLEHERHEMSGARVVTEDGGILINYSKRPTLERPNTGGKADTEIG